MSMKIRRAKRNMQTTDFEAVPKPKSRLLAIVLRESKSSVWKWVSYKSSRFKVGEHTYFTIPEGAYITINRVLVAVYLEGVSLPITHMNIKKEKVTKEITNLKGEKKRYTFVKIKGLKYDSKIIDILLNRGLADEFTRQRMDIPQLAIIILLIFNLVMSVAGIIVLAVIGGNLGGL